MNVFVICDELVVKMSSLQEEKLCKVLMSVILLKI